MVSSARPASAIHSYSLFGEHAHLPDVVHCETIAARSELHGWELSPHRHARLHQVLMVDRGSGQVRLDDAVVPLGNGSVVNVPAALVHGFTFAPSTEGWVVTMASELLDEILVGVGDVHRDLALPRVIDSDRAARKLARDLMQRIWDEFNGRSKGRALMLRGLSASLLAWVARRIEGDPSSQQVSRNATLLRDFESLIEQHYDQRWGVERYADALAISPTHLSRVCRKTAGIAALSLIEARAMREARRQLAYTNRSVKAIALELGYGDPTYFTRAFTRDAGVSPRAFRAQVSGMRPPARDRGRA